MEHPQLRKVTDLADPALDDYLRMTDVRLRSRVEVERGMFMAESYEVISRAIDAGMAPRSFLMGEKWLEKFAPLYTPFPEVPVYVGAEPLIEQLTEQMHAAAGELQFELAARLRDEVGELKKELRQMQSAGHA